MRFVSHDDGSGQPEAQPDAQVDLSATDGAVAIKGRSPWQIVVSRFSRDKVSLVAGIITACSCWRR